ncbi:MAG: hypothetical protein JRN62_09870 [Nitrososphaerota archaeon]|nr:hypothetical protein [Nitrososphaerota archaeon]
MSPRASQTIGVGFLTLLLVEFLLLSQFPLHPYNGAVPPNPNFDITYQNASRWIITPANPLGQLTSFLVYDGPNNIYTLLFSAFVVAVLFLFVNVDRMWILGPSLFLTTNLAGLVSPTAIYLTPLTNYGNWGMSSATFASLSFALVGCIWVMSSITKPKSTPRVELSVALLSIFIVGGIIESFSMGGPTISWSVFHVHLLSFVIGGLSAALIFRRVQTRAKASSRTAFQPLESRFPKRPP